MVVKGFKLDKVIKGSTQIPGTKMKVPNIVLGGGLSLLLIGGSYFLFKDNIPFLQGGGEGLNTNPVETIHYRAIPEKVRPNEFFTIAGVFLDKDQNPTTVPEGFYRVTEDDGSGRGAENILTNGSLGQNISTFVRQISTNEFKREKVVTVEVSENSNFT